MFSLQANPPAAEPSVAIPELPSAPTVEPVETVPAQAEEEEEEPVRERERQRVLA